MFKAFFIFQYLIDNSCKLPATVRVKGKLVLGICILVTMGTVSQECIYVTETMIVKMGPMNGRIFIAVNNFV